MKWAVVIALTSFAYAVLALEILSARQSVWIDTDPSVGDGEVDDGLALIQALSAPELDIKGISVVFGNTGVDSCYGDALKLVRSWGHIPVYKGAGSVYDSAADTAVAAMADALKTDKLTLIALGPLTNVASLLRSHPLAAQNISRLIAVAGRRPQQRFRVGSMEDSFPDLNFEKDIVSFEYVIGALGEIGVPVVLTPWEISSNAWLKQSDIEFLKNKICPGAPPALSYESAEQACTICGVVGLESSRCAAVMWVLHRSGLWAELWETHFGAEGFNPFDTLAIAYAISPSQFVCSKVIAEFVRSYDASGADGASVVEAQTMSNISVHLSGSGAPSELHSDGKKPSAPEFVLRNSSAATNIVYCYSLQSYDAFVKALKSRILIAAGVP